jgi:hypothetical protein
MSCDNNATSFLLDGVLRQRRKKADFSWWQNVMLIAGSQ